MSGLQLKLRLGVPVTKYCQIMAKMGVHPLFIESENAYNSR
jgi:hypothetical protein